MSQGQYSQTNHAPIPQGFQPRGPFAAGALKRAVECDGPELGERAVRAPFFSQIAAELESIHYEVSELAKQAEGIADQLFGPEPPAVEAADRSPDPRSIRDYQTNKAQQIMSTLYWLKGSLNRISREIQP